MCIAHIGENLCYLKDCQIDISQEAMKRSFSRYNARKIFLDVSGQIFSSVNKRSGITEYQSGTRTVDYD